MLSREMPFLPPVTALKRLIVKNCVGFLFHLGLEKKSNNLKALFLTKVCDLCNQKNPKSIF